MRRNKISVILTAMLFASIFLAGIQSSFATTTNYGDKTVTNNNSDNFGEIWDLTDGDITLSFTYDATGLQDDAGSHAWAELGVKSADTTANFNPYSPLRTVGYGYSCESTLYADQDIAIGTATITGNQDQITIQVNIDGPWKMFYAHVHVATDLEDIPQTKKGTPIPGQFMVSVPYDPPVSTDCYQIDPDDIKDYCDGDPLIVAVHLSVGRPIPCCSETIWMIGDAETGVPLSNYVDELNLPNNWPAESAVYPTFPDPFVVGTNLDTEFPWISNYANGYATDFDIDWNGALPFGGTLLISWSPGKSAYETKIITSTDGGETNTFYATGSTDPNGWEGYPLELDALNIDPLADGDHTFRLQHTTGDGALWDYIKLEQPCIQMETAWADGTDFPWKTWATYMTCTPTEIEVAGSGVWLSTDYPYTADALAPDPDDQSLHDKLILQKIGGSGEGSYDLPSTPTAPGANHYFWFDRDGVDQYQANNPLNIDGASYNTEGIYDIVITLHATSDTTGTAYMTINGLSQGFETDGNWQTVELSPAGMTFTGDMKNLVVFYGCYGYGTPSTVTFSDIEVTQ